MSSQVIKGRPVWIGGYEFSNKLNVAALDFGADDLDGTTLADDTHVHIGGVKSAGFAIEGFFDAAQEGNSIDAQLFGNMGLDGVAVAFAALQGNAGEIAFFMPTVEGEYNHDGAIGELDTFSAGGMAQGNLIRGTIHINATGVAASDNSDGIQMGAADSGQIVYAGLFVTGVAGTSPTLDMVVESDDNGSFSSATSRITFSQVTENEAQLLQVAGPITDDYWRIDYTIGGTDPEFNFMVVVGIQ